MSAAAPLLTRPFSGRIADRLGYKVVLIPALLSITLGLGLLTLARTTGALVVSASLFGMGFGTAYPVFVAYVIWSFGHLIIWSLAAHDRIDE